MIEEINTSQYVQHYFEKVYTELEHSSEAFLRAALEFVQQQDGLLEQPGAIDSLTRLARDVAHRHDQDSDLTAPDTNPAQGIPGKGHLDDSATDATVASDAQKTIERPIANSQDGANFSENNTEQTEGGEEAEAGESRGIRKLWSSEIETSVVVKKHPMLEILLTIHRHQ